MKKFLCRFMAEDFFVIQITHTRVTVKFSQVYLKFSVFMICIFRIQFLMKNQKNHANRKA